MTEPEPLLSVACHCRCNCDRRPNRRITCEGCNRGVGPGCCARNAQGGTPEIGATTCICHRCLEEGPPPQLNPQEEKELREAEDSTARWGHLLESTGLVDRATARWGAVYCRLLDIKGMAQIRL